MKPLGLTADFKVIRPSQVEDAIWDAVEAAIDAGWTPSRFKSEAAESWDSALKEKARLARKEW